MGAEPGQSWNYFNYFTEVEEHFQRARGTSLFLMSPLDWALVEAWKNGGIPLEAVLRGIDAAFEKWRAKKVKHRAVNSVAYCAQAVTEEAQAMAKGGTQRKTSAAKPPFELEDLKRFLDANITALTALPAFVEITRSLEQIAAAAEQHYGDLEDLEQRLTILEEKMAAIARTRMSDEDLLQGRRELDGTLRPYRGKMTADQLAMLERQYLERWILERSGLPRLSLFYLA